MRTLNQAWQLTIHLLECLRCTEFARGWYQSQAKDSVVSAGSDHRRYTRDLGFVFVLFCFSQGWDFSLSSGKWSWDAGGFQASVDHGLDVENRPGFLQGGSFPLLFTEMP